MGMATRRQAGGDFAARQAIAGHAALEALQCERRFRIAIQPIGGVYDTRGAFAEALAETNRLGRNPSERSCGGAGVLPGIAERISREGQPGQSRQLQQPRRQCVELIGGDTQQLQFGAFDEALGQSDQPVARKHQLAQAGTGTQPAGQRGQRVVREDQPAQRRWQGVVRQVADAIGLEADHLQRLALAEYLGDGGEGVVRAEQHPELFQASETVRQLAQSIPGKIQHFQAVGEVENFIR